jgi:hypothetical protein
VEYRRTAVIKLDAPDGADPLLRETVEQFKNCANTASEWCWHGDDGYHVTSKAKAERALYDQLRDKTDLTANLVQKGIRRAVEAIKSGVERLKRGENTSKPYFSAESTVYDKRSATFYRDHVSSSTVDGRVECEYILPDDSEIPQPSTSPTRTSSSGWRTSSTATATGISTLRCEKLRTTRHPNPNPSTEQSLEWIWASTTSQSLPRVDSGRQTSLITGVESTRSAVARSSSVA